MRPVLSAGFALLLASSPLALAQTGGVAGHQMQPDQMRASKVIGSTLYDTQNNDIGKVSDLILDRDGRVAEVVVSTGGFAGIGGKYVAVKISELRKGPSADKYTLAMTKQQLDSAPAFHFPGDNTETGSTPARTPAPAAGSSAPARH
jgi:sporulation protein YlmC with PRC-barrel domain